MKNRLSSCSIVSSLAISSVFSLALLGCGGGAENDPASQSMAATAAVQLQAIVRPAAPPNTPTSLNATPGANNVSIGFTPPTLSGGSAIVLYTASCSDGVHKFVGSAAKSPVTVSGLTQSVNYSCTVNAANSQIDGTASTPIIVNLPGSTPLAVFASAPQNVSIARGNGGLSISFSPPASNGGYAVIGYSATCSGGAISGSALSSPIIVTGLKNGTTYACSVTAINAQGAGASSASVSATPSASAAGATAPGIPVAVVALPGNGLANISFSAPSNNGGSPINSYWASCTAAAGGLSISSSTLSSPIQVSGLNNGSTYNCSVAAANAYGSSNSPTVAVTPSSSISNSVAAPVSLTLAATVRSLAADGTSGVMALLKTATGAVYGGPDVTVSFSSPCVAAGSARIDSIAVAHNGMAEATYQPTGCTGADTLTATATLAGHTFTSSSTVVVSATPALSPKAALGKAMFFDPTLSASGAVSCASCHAPSRNYLPANQLATQPGGVAGKAAGFRASPSAAYAALTRPFSFITQLTNKQGTTDTVASGKLGTPSGGLMWDGRAADVFAQATGPFIAAQEMANANSAAVLSKLLTRPYIVNFNAIYGVTKSSSNADTVLTNIANAIGQFETEDRSFMPFNSKFDAVQAGLAQFNAQEANGQLLFFDAHKAACFGCHTPFSVARAAQQPAMFSDFDYRGDGVPRNWALSYNNDSLVNTVLTNLGLGSLLNGGGLGAPNHSFYDMGVCGPLRTDSTQDTALCAIFRTPPLRNVALKGSYFHNGIYSNLSQVLNFYMNRDVNPQFVYLKADGSADIQFNDLPVQYRANIVSRPPFTPVPGGRITPAEMQDVISFLCTLTDGFDPANPDAYRQPLQCSNSIRR